MAIMKSERAGDEAAIRALEAAYDAAWAAADVTGLLDCLAEDAVVVNPRGEVAEGREAIGTMLQAFLDGPGKDSQHASRILRVVSVTDDVAVVDGEAVIEGAADGEIVHRFTDILVRRDGTWKIAHVRAYHHRP